MVAKKLNINTNIAATDFGDWTHMLFWTSFWYIEKTEESAMMPNDKWVCSVLFLFGVISFDVCSCPLLLASQVEHLVDRFIKFWQLLPPPSRRRQLFWYSKLFSDEKNLSFLSKKIDVRQMWIRKPQQKKVCIVTMPVFVDWNHSYFKCFVCVYPGSKLLYKGVSRYTVQ